MIDWDRVGELRDEIGDDGFDEVVEMFLQEADDAVAQLSPELHAKALEAALHSIKGSALNLGFSHLAGICQSGEKRAASGSTDVNLDEIRASYYQSKSVFLTKNKAA